MDIAGESEVIVVSKAGCVGWRMGSEAGWGWNVRVKNREAKFRLEEGGNVEPGE